MHIARTGLTGGKGALFDDEAATRGLWSEKHDRTRLCGMRSNRSKRRNFSQWHGLLLSRDRRRLPSGPDFAALISSMRAPQQPGELELGRNFK
jgi:hypothetical protein